MLFEDDLELFYFSLALGILDIHGKQGLVESLPHLVHLVVEGIVQGALVNQAFDGSLVLVSLYFDVLHDFIISIPTAIYVYREFPKPLQNISGDNRTGLSLLDY